MAVAASLAASCGHGHGRMAGHARNLTFPDKVLLEDREDFLYSNKQSNQDEGGFSRLGLMDDT